MSTREIEISAVVTPPPHHSSGEYIWYQAFCESLRKERHMYQAWYCHGCGTWSLPLLPPNVKLYTTKAFPLNVLSVPWRLRI